MDRWAWQQLQPWLEIRAALPVGPLLCIIHGPTAGRNWEQSAARKQLRRVAAAASVRRRFAPHQLRHAHAIEMAHEGVPLVVIQRQLGHANLGITSIYLQGIDNAEIIDTVHARRAPMVPNTARSRRDAATGGGQADDFLAAGPRPDRQPGTPGVASGPQGAPFIAKERRPRRKRPAPIAEGALTQRYG
jgi:hypothetical protein